MEEQKPFVIPTMSKAKISHLLSYPVGAEAIAHALEGVPQMKQLALQFYHWSDLHLRRGEYEFLRVEYLNGVSAHYTEYLYKREPQYRWEIVVQPVPRVKRHQVKTYITETALPLIKAWLVKNAELEERGNTLLSFLLDEKKEEFIVKPIDRLEPVVR